MWILALVYDFYKTAPLGPCDSGKVSEKFPAIWREERHQHGGGKLFLDISVNLMDRLCARRLPPATRGTRVIKKGRKTSLTPISRCAGGSVKSGNVKSIEMSSRGSHPNLRPTWCGFTDGAFPVETAVNGGCVDSCSRWHQIPTDSWPNS